ncbi:MAG: FISUMP domain-containing protein [Bacteroidota bacterium]|nr:FISUMP domain-containing protein [Bacteroidota bacterium]MDP4233578.1 FISUMP domain-containing protein [Bacteroidota bacterium]MDP4243648.1 FISUMP domain-containing protein [Bacteroidota bacterium]MDP4287765.1 FISUMP domain-containing protein [Bacteroidota bacterium]
MKPLKPIGLLSLLLLFPCCKASQPTGPSSGGPTPSLFEVSQVLDSTQSTFLTYANQTGGDVRESIIRTVSWLNSQPSVASAATFDSLYIDIKLKSGLTTSFYFEEVNDSGYDVFRGGSDPHGNMTLSGSGTNSANSITNKKVLLFAADTKSLPDVVPQIARTLKRLANSGLGLDVTVLKDEQCSYGVVEHFGDYGLVIMDTHGQKDAFLVGSILDLSAPAKTEADLKGKVNAQIDAAAYDKLTSGSLKLAASVKANPNRTNWQKSVIPGTSRTVWFSSKYLNLLPPMTNTVILGNMCYSGWSAASWTYSWPQFADTVNGAVIVKIKGGSATATTDPIEAAFVNRNPISYYGYAHADGTSAGVQDSFASVMEDSLVSRLVGNLDSTKIINLRADNTTEYFNQYPFLERRTNVVKTIPPLYFKHYGADNYSYEHGCVDTFTDARDGQVYRAVCIGKQTWMAQNLNYDVPGSECYDSLSSNCAQYGKLYRRSMVMNGASPTNANPSGVQGICPKGWHVPSASEWQQLIDFLGDSTTAGGALKAVSPLWASPNSRATNSSGFTALPSGEWVDGNAAASTHLFYNMNYYAMFHMATELHPGQIDVLQLDYNSTLAHWFTYAATIPPVYAGNGACRCVKDP